MRENVEYRLLKRYFPRQRTLASGRGEHLATYTTRIASVMGTCDLSAWRDYVVIDFGCGYGEGTIELARHGIRHVIGVDSRPEVLIAGQRSAERAGVADACQFCTRAPEVPADVVISIDAFEHFDDPSAVLTAMAAMLADDGRVVASFGPTWYHPRGGHLFSAFPWAHLLLSEPGLCRWRRDFRDDGAGRFCDVEGGLNKMTIRRFERLVEASPLQIERTVLRPIQKLRTLHNRWTRELCTSVVDCVLTKR